MKAKLSTIRTKLLDDNAMRMFQSSLLLLAVLATLAFAVVAVGSAVFSDQLVAGPSFVVDSPENEPAALGTVTITPVSLADTSLRVFWGVASASVLLGIAVFLLAALRLLAREPQKPIFGKEAATAASAIANVGGILVVSGALARDWMTGSIGRSAGIPESNLSTDFDLWVFDVPAPAYIFVAFVVGWIWKRGSALQEEVDQVV